MKIVFMGTPDFAVGSLEALIRAGHEITAVVTQPDKPKGRSEKLQFPPVKECALAHQIPVFQPKKIKTEEAIAQLRQYPADIFVVAAFGQILSQEILDMPKYGCVNIHASLLPKYRGASPIQNAIIAGEEKTGVTIMQMDAGLDTGDMLYVKETAISDQDTFETLHDRLLEIGGEAIVEALELLERDKLQPVKQQDELSCYAPLIQKSMGKIDFEQDAFDIDKKIRGLTPWPSAYAYYHGKQMKLWKAVPVETDSTAKAKTVEKVEKDYFQIRCKTGALKIYEVQLEGKKRMSAHDFLLGVKMQAGECLE